MCATDKN
jgi:hypothetical protein